ncbi:MFS transporter [Actinoplanes sp. URMC 104]|uniref:MFS transporter n=1 Tax=Actinoplanes sp. URMC 104 TaxID=3423409 RepID=UPI003F1D33CE
MTPRRRPLAGLLIAEAVSLAGSHIASVAVPWLVLVTTGSATRVGVVALAQTLPFVLAGALGGAVVDRTGPRWVAVAADVVSAVVVGLVPLLHLAGALTFGRLVLLVALAGAAGGCGNIAKRALLPLAVEASGTPMARATALFESAGRAALLVGLPLGGVLVAAFGPASVLVVDAASFAFCAAFVAATVRVGRAAPAPAEPGDDGPAAGLAFLRRDRLILVVTAILFVTNLVDQAYLAVFLPVWVRETGAGPAALGLIGGVFGLGAVVGAAVYSLVAVRLPRVPTFAVCLLLGGAPKLFAIGLSDDAGPALAVAFGCGAAAAAVNPILLAVGYERIPAHLRGRVLGLLAALSFAGLPLGALLGGLAVDAAGLRPTLLAAGCLYLAVTLVPFPALRLLKTLVEPAARDERRPLDVSRPAQEVG